MSLFRRKQQAAPAPDPGPRVRVSLVEYVDNETGKTHWDVKVHTRSTYGYRSTVSVTDDYGFKDRNEAQVAYHRRVAIERGEIKTGVSTHTLVEAEIP